MRRHNDASQRFLAWNEWKNANVGLIEFRARPERTHGYSYSSCCFIFCCELTARDNLFERPVEDLFKRSDSGYCCRDLYEHGADLHVL